MHVDRNASLARVVLEHPECAHLLRRRHLDYCCRGALTLAEACVGKGVDAAALEGELEAEIAQHARRESPDPRTLGTPELLADLTARHRRLLQRATLTAAPLLVKVARAHADDLPNVCELLGVFCELLALVQAHVEEEETGLFPDLASPSAESSRIARELRSVREEHRVIGEQLTRIRSLAGDFAVPEGACRSYRASMDELSWLDEELCRHVHVENHVLMPRFVRGGGGPPWSQDGGAQIPLL